MFCCLSTLTIFLTDLDITYGEYNHSVTDPVDWPNLDRLRDQLSITEAAAVFDELQGSEWIKT